MNILKLGIEFQSCPYRSIPPPSTICQTCDGDNFFGKNILEIKKMSA